MDPDAYAEPGPFTTLAPEQHAAVRLLPGDVEARGRAAQGLLIAPDDPTGAGLDPARLAERNERRADRLLARALELDPSPLDQARAADHRVVGTCRHVAVLATALLRASGTPARARCGFATYFVPGRAVDHWIVEHWSAPQQRWIRMDPEVLGLDVVTDPADLQPADFLTGGEAWQAVRSGRSDAQGFGVDGTDHWGPGEIRGNALRDLAALHRIEVLPWDEWGPMAASYAGETDEGFDVAIDDLAAATATEDEAALARAWSRHAVPADLLG